VMFRTVGDAVNVMRAIAPLERRVVIEHLLEVPTVRLTTVPGFDTAVFPYTTDIPYLDRWGRALLFGPGSVHVAHTAKEFIDVTELLRSVDAYMSIASTLLSSG
jgi:acetylornithine deacetylase